MSHAYLMTDEYERAIEADQDDPPIVTMLALELMGRRDQAMAHARQQLAAGMPPLLRSFFEVTIALVEGKRSDALARADDTLTIWRLRDPCATYYLARGLSLMQHPSAIPMLRRSVEGGFHCYPFFTRDPWLDPLRAEPGFSDILRLAQTGYRAAADAFVAAGGERILGALQRE